MMNKRKYKSQIVSICLILTLAVMSNQVKAQSDLPTNPNIVSVNGGISLTSVLLKTLLNGDSVKYAFTSTPTLVLNYDRFVTSWLSIGAGFARQSMSIKFEDYIDNNNVRQMGDFNADFKRNHVHLKALATWSQSKGDLYAGLRLGYLWYKSDLSLEKRDLKVLNKVDKLLQVGRPSLGIPMGGRYFISDNIGLNAEVNIGAPFVISGGLSFRFGGGKKN
jgi:hypothetical protein